MNMKIWLAFLLAPVIGIGIGWYVFQAAHDEPATDTTQATDMATRNAASSLGELANVFDSNSATVDHAPDREAAFMAALQEPAGPNRIKTLQAAYIRWVLQAPLAALASIERIPADERQEVVAHALAMLAQQKPEHFLNYANGITNNYTTYMAAAMGVLAESNPKLALSLIQRNQERGDPHGVVIGAILPNLIKDDLAFAAQTVAAMKDRASIAHIQQVATAYAKQDPKQAYDWVNQVLANRTDIAPSDVLNDITGSLVASNPAEAVNYLNRAADPMVKKSLLHEIAIQKGQEDLAAAWTWLNQYKADEHYGEAAMNLLYRWSYSKPEEVAKILPGIADVQLQSMAATHLSRFWQKKDPQGHQAWLASLPPGTIKNSAMESP
jgi:hypothetical protein